MKPMSSLFLGLLGFLGWAASGRAADGSSPGERFELCVTAREPGPAVTPHEVNGSGDPLLLLSPAALSSADLRAVEAVTKSSWYVLSGSHRTSTLKLRLKPGSVARFQGALQQAISRGNPLALLIGGKVIGLLSLQRTIEGDELAIDASFFSQGTESEKASATRVLAHRIQSTLP